MKNQDTTVDTTLSYLALRRLLGWLGILLPVILWVANGFKIESSISHHFYTQSSVVFTSVLSAFGLFLFTYRGREKEKEMFSDNFITNIAGAMALVTALIPTGVCQNGFEGVVQIGNVLDDCCGGGGIETIWVHNNFWLGGIHLAAAGGFLILVGWIAFDRFTKGHQTPAKIIFYRTCGIVVWISIAMLLINFKFDLGIGSKTVFVGECIALFFFGIAWLVKGKGLRLLGV